MAPIEWEHLSEDQHELLVLMLLNHLHPTFRRIDGSGGDGSRDVQFNGIDGLHIFQLKSFTGRLDARWRKQIRRSLSTASSLNPVDWTLIVPIDPTPGELAWLDGLRRSVAFPVQCLGRAWLDAQMAVRPAIGRYVLEYVANEIVPLAQIVVDVVEPLGEEIIVHGTSEGSAGQSGAEEKELPPIASDARAAISARFERTARFRPGERLRLGVEPGRVHVFDARSGMALTSPPVD